jgi:serine/threonine protein kinase
VRSNGPLPAHDAVEIVGQIARALDAAHARGLVHRDVKPANVLLEEAPSTRVYLTDFGLCLERQDGTGLTKWGQRVGTVAYSAPEQLRGEMVDAHADIYALGGLLYTLLTGSVPFPAASEAEAIAAQLGQAPPRPGVIVDGLPQDLDTVVARAMAKASRERYSSAGELARAAARPCRAALDCPAALRWMAAMGCAERNPARDG